MRKSSGLGLFFHSLGLSTIGAALFLEGLVLSSILEHGYFSGIEQESVIVYSELFLLAFSLAYLCYLVWRFVVSAMR